MDTISLATFASVPNKQPSEAILPTMGTLIPSNTRSIPHKSEDDKSEDGPPFSERFSNYHDKNKKPAIKTWGIIDKTDWPSCSDFDFDKGIFPEGKMPWPECPDPDWPIERDERQMIVARGSDSLEKEKMLEDHKVFVATFPGPYVGRAFVPVGSVFPRDSWRLAEALHQNPSKGAHRTQLTSRVHKSPPKPRQQQQIRQRIRLQAVAGSNTCGTKPARFMIREIPPG